MQFFKQEKFFARDRVEDVERSNGFRVQKNWSRKYIYDDFEYDEETESLVYAEMINYSFDGRVDSSCSGSADTSLSLYKIDLKSCNSVIAVGSYAGESSQGVKLTGNYRVKKIIKEEEWDSEDLAIAVAKMIGVNATDKDLEDLIEKDFGNLEEDKKITFVVSPEMAPRIKSALADLLKAHGVKPNKY